MKQRKPLSIPIFIVVYACVIVACVALDQLTKHFIEIAVKANGGKIRILGDWLTLVWTLNTGATGGMLSGLSWRNWLFFFLTLLGIPAFGFLLWRSRTRSVWGQVAFSFIIGGTIGNAIDRLIFAEKGFFTGSVRDFVRVEGFFGIFNVADSFLVVGVILAILAIVFFDHDSLLNAYLQERKAKKSGAIVDEMQTSVEDIEQSPSEQTPEQQPNDNSSEQTDSATTEQ